jgi:hypothetical protein
MKKIFKKISNSLIVLLFVSLCLILITGIIYPIINGFDSKPPDWFILWIGYTLVLIPIWIISALVTQYKEITTFIYDFING